MRTTSEAGAKQHQRNSNSGDAAALLPLATAQHAAPSLLSALRSSPLVHMLSCDEDALAAAEGTLSAAAEFGALLVWFFIADRTQVLGHSGKSYNRDTFLFVYLAVWGVAFVRGAETCARPVTLGRKQTEEWKGWMQVRVYVCMCLCINSSSPMLTRLEPGHSVACKLSGGCNRF